MSVTFPAPAPDPSPEEIARGLAEIERHLADQPPAPAVVPATEAEAKAEQLDQETPEVEGETKRVRQLRAQVAEARRLIELQDDDTPLLIDTPRVRERRHVAHEAARLHELGQDPAMRAYQALRVRRLLVAVAMLSLVLAVAWSTAGVQKFAADGARPGSPEWLFAWLVEPFLALGLLLVVGARAYLGTRGTALTHPALVKVEWLFLALSLGMNAWPYLPIVAEPFSFSRLVLHLIGPVVSVAIVTTLPIILEAFSELDHGRLTGPLTGLTYRPNTATDGLNGDVSGKAGKAAELAPWLAEARRLIAAGELPATPSASRIRQTMRCGMDIARAVRDALAEDAP